jgi:hypothetical protein
MVRSKTRRPGGFKNLLWELNVSEIESKVSQIKQDDDIHRLYKEGFDNLRAGFEEFLTENNVTYDDEYGYFKIYSSAAVESTDIIRTSGSFHGNEWFSNVVVTSEDTDWYGKVLYIDIYFMIFINEDFSVSYIPVMSNVINLNFLGTFIIGIFR